MKKTTITRIVGRVKKHVIDYQWGYGDYYNHLSPGDFEYESIDINEDLIISQEKVDCRVWSKIESSKSEIDRVERHGFLFLRKRVVTDCHYDYDITEKDLYVVKMLNGDTYLTEEPVI